MKINPLYHRPIDSTLRCICGRTWEVTIWVDGVEKVMEAHTSTESLRAIDDAAIADDVVLGTIKMDACGLVLQVTCSKLALAFGNVVWEKEH